MKEPKDPMNTLVMDAWGSVWEPRTQFISNVAYEDRPKYWMPVYGPGIKLSWKKLLKKHGPLAVYRVEE